MVAGLGQPRVATAARAATIPVVACPHPFLAARETLEAPAGSTIAEILEFAQPDPVLRRYAHVYIDDWYVQPRFYRVVRPRAGRRVTLRVVPGRGDGGGKDILGVVLSIVVVAASIFAPYLAPAGWGLVAGGELTLAGAVVAAGINIAGNLLIRALIPPVQPKLDSLSGTSQGSPTLFISGARNQARPYSPVPQVLGKVRVVPAHAALPFTELVGADQYVRMLLSFGHGPVTLSDIKLGETALESFAGVETEFRRGWPSSLLTAKGNWSAAAGTFPSPAAFGDRYTVNNPGTVDGATFAVGDSIVYTGFGDGDQDAESWDHNGDLPVRLYPDSVFEEALSILLLHTGGNTPVQTTQPDADEIVVDLTAPQGLVIIDERGDRFQCTVTVRVQYRASGTADPLTTAGDVVLSGRRTEAIRKGLRIQVPRGQYDVHVTRLTGNLAVPLPGQAVQDVFWTALRSITNEDPTSLDGEALLAVRIKATDQLHGAPDEISAVVQSIVPDYDSDTESWVHRPTSNPASLFRAVAQGAANPRPLADGRLAVANLEDWHGECAAAGREFDMARDFASTVQQTLADIAAAGRARLAPVDGRYGVAIGRAQANPVQFFTPRNSWSYRGHRRYVDLPHGFRRRFQNREKDWRQDVLTVYRDGFDADNATRFESLEAAGITDPDQVWLDGRFHFAQAELQPEDHSFFCDVEHLVATEGDLIGFAHDVPLVGLGWGRVKEVTDDGGGNATGVDLDDVVVMEAGKSYSVRFRYSDGTSRVEAVETVVGEQGALTFATPFALVDAPAQGDLYIFGETGEETLSLLIRTIEHGPNLTARLTCVNDDPALWGDLGTIPPFESGLSAPAGLVAPAIGSIRSDETVLVRASDGTLQSRIVITLLRTVTVPSEATGVQAAWRVAASDGGFTVGYTHATDEGQVAIPAVQDGEAYEIKLRYVRRDGSVGPWSGIVSHTVTGKLTPPQPLSGLTLSVFGGQANLRWDEPRELDVVYGGRVQFRHSPAFSGALWASSASIGQSALARTTFAALPLKPGTYLARVRDLAGQVSTVVGISTKQASVLPFALFVAVEEAPTFAGVKTDTEVESTWLQLASEPTGEVKPSGIYDFAAPLDLGSVKRMRLTGVLDTAAVNVNDIFDDRLDPIDSWEDFDGTEQAEADAQLWVRETDDDPAGTPTWSAWTRLDSAEFEARAFQFQARLTSEDPTYNVRIFSLGVRAEEFDTTV